MAVYCTVVVAEIEELCLIRAVSLSALKERVSEIAYLRFNNWNVFFLVS